MSLATPQEDPRCAWETLHELLYPIGDRQESALGQGARDGSPRRELLRMQSVVATSVERRAAAEGASAEVLDWIRLADCADPAPAFIGALLGAGCRQEDLDAFARLWGSSVGDAYTAFMSADLRHRLGEHYTPRPLVRRIISAARREDFVVDPACGDGRFLLALLEVGHAPDRLAGADLNPLAVMMARYGAWEAVGRPPSRPAVVMEWGDFLAGGRSEVLGLKLPDPLDGLDDADFFVGNPPWVLWRNLGDDYRGAIAQVFGGTHLNQAKGWAARVSGGQTDLSHLFVHESAERVAPNGRVAYVLPRSVFKGPIGASVVRNGRTHGGREYAYTHVIDLSGSAVFEEVRSDAVVAFVQADRAQDYPVAWEPALGDATVEASSIAAWPSDPDDAASSWSTGGDRPVHLAQGQTRASLVGRGGVNTGGGNGVFYVDVLSGASERDIVNVRNRPSRGKPDRQVTMPVETAYVRPLLKGTDIRPWVAVASGFAVLPHEEADLRKPVDESRLLREAPLTHRYLSEFKEELASRKELARWGGEWYSLFRIGPYTADCWRVVWPSSAGARIRAAVLKPDDRTVPDQKVVLVAFEQAGPAHFLCGLLNSRHVRGAIASGSGLDASPSLTKRLLLPQWDATNRGHRAVSDFSVAAHSAAGVDVDAGHLDSLVDRLYG